jgi:hypothetical protein
MGLSSLNLFNSNTNEPAIQKIDQSVRLEKDMLGDSEISRAQAKEISRYIRILSILIW